MPVFWQMAQTVSELHIIGSSTVPDFLYKHSYLELELVQMGHSQSSFETPKTFQSFIIQVKRMALAQGWAMASFAFCHVFTFLPEKKTKTKVDSQLCVKQRPS